MYTDRGTSGRSRIQSRQSRRSARRPACPPTTASRKSRAERAGWLWLLPCNWLSCRENASSEDAMAVDPSVIDELVEVLGDRTCAVSASSFDASSPEASNCGVYAWWADETANRLIAAQLGSADAASPIYVGKAGGGPSSRTLKSRVRTHLNGTIRNSTFRWSLTAILVTTPEFAAARSDPCEILRSRRLSSWMREHLEVAIIPVGRPEFVNRVEDEAITRYQPPLNGTRRGRLSELRRRLRTARETRGCPPPE